MSYVDILKQEYGLSDEDIAELMSAGVLQGELEQGQRDMRFYERMARTPVPQGRGWGDVYRAAHPLEHVGAALQTGAGFYGRHKEDQARRKAQEDLADLRRLFLQGGRGNRPATMGTTTFPLGTRAGRANTGWEPIV